MPVTPFHLGPALLFKAGGPSRFSLGLFAAVQIIIDLESVYNMMAERMPIHATLHTFPGALAVSFLAIVPGRYGVSYLKGKLVRYVGPEWARVRTQLGPVLWVAAMTGALLGGVTHVLLDAMMHSDAQPFLPFRSGNPFLIPGSFEWLHIACALAALIGLLVWALRAKGQVHETD